MAFSVTSDTFRPGTLIPARYTCDGENISPPLTWAGAPEGTESFALIFEDPDAPSKTWVHWVLFNLPANQTGLRERIQNIRSFPNGAIHGVNDFQAIGYRGPCPPGGTHRYYLKLYALDSELDLDAGATRDQLLDSMEGHILANTEIMGRYKRL